MSASGTPYQLLPEMTPEEYAKLKESVREAGEIQVAIIQDEHGNILDGHNRQRVYGELTAEGVAIRPPRIEVKPGLSEPQKRKLILELNLARRNLTAEQRAALWQRLLEEGMSPQDVAEASGVTRQAVSKATRSNPVAPSGPDYREPEVRALAGKGKTTEQIAKELNMGVGRVREILGTPRVDPDPEKRSAPLDVGKAFPEVKGIAYDKVHVPLPEKKKRARSSNAVNTPDTPDTIGEQSEAIPEPAAIPKASAAVEELGIAVTDEEELTAAELEPESSPIDIAVDYMRDYLSQFSTEERREILERLWDD